MTVGVMTWRSIIAGACNVRRGEGKEKTALKCSRYDDGRYDRLI